MTAGSRNLFAAILAAGALAWPGLAHAITDTPITIVENGKPLPDAQVTLTSKHGPAPDVIGKTDGQGKVNLRYDEKTTDEDAVVEMTVTMPDGRVLRRDVWMNFLLGDGAVDMADREFSLPLRPRTEDDIRRAASIAVVRAIGPFSIAIAVDSAVYCTYGKGNTFDYPLPPSAYNIDDSTGGKKEAGGDGDKKETGDGGGVKEFKPSGSFDNPGTQERKVTTGVETEKQKEHDKPRGVELVYKPDASTPACTKIATIQVMWYVDPDGKPHKNTDYIKATGVPKGKSSDYIEKISTPDGYFVDGQGGETTPYYQDDAKGGFGLPLGDSDGKGGGKPTHITDMPGEVYGGWSKHFEAWTVCIEGAAAGTILAGVMWEITTVKEGGKVLNVAKITDKNPKKPTKNFSDAIKSWEKNAQPGFKEPGGGFKF